MRARVAVLASGAGSNLQAVLDHLDRPGAHRRAEVALVVSDRRQAGALDRARAHGVPAATLAAGGREGELDAVLTDHGIEIVALAGYLRLVPPEVTRRFRGRLLNVHPALLPAFGGAGMYGARVHRAVIESGARLSGATVHFVDEVYDHGAIIAQWPVPVFEEDTAEALAARVLHVEHALYPRVIDGVAAGAIALDDDGRVRGAFLIGTQGAIFTLPRANADLEAELDAALGL